MNPIPIPSGNQIFIFSFAVVVGFADFRVGITDDFGSVSNLAEDVGGASLKENKCIFNNLTSFLKIIYCWNVVAPISFLRINKAYRIFSKSGAQQGGLGIVIPIFENIPTGLLKGCAWQIRNHEQWPHSSPGDFAIAEQ